LILFADDSGLSSPYTPAQLQADYGMDALYKAGLTGAGRTIGIVDVYGSPTIRADLASFDTHFGLPAPPHFTIIQPAGPVPSFNPENSEMLGWAAETTLDVEWSHAMAPGASIVLAETGVDEVEGTTGMPEIMKAENYMILHEHVTVISQSFAATEETFPSAASLMNLRAVYGEAEKHSVTVLAGAGDWGASGPTNNTNTYYDRRVVAWPASDPLVTAVGGTDVYLNGAGTQLEAIKVWNQSGGTPEASGGGVSEYFARPSWQDGVAKVVGSRRGIPDISMFAACDTGALIYSSFSGFPGLAPVCGTSLATPLFAGVVAIAAQLANHALGLINPTLYSLGSTRSRGLVDVIHGNTSVSVTVAGKAAEVNGYSAVVGYDLASGWGTVNAADLVPELAGRPLPKEGVLSLPTEGVWSLAVGGLSAFVHVKGR
jgi:subtilase family serine protease